MATPTLNMSSLKNKVDFNKPIDKSAVKNKTAIVTGGASGLGHGIAVALAESGATVIVADIKEKEGEDVAKEMQLKGHDLIFIPTDVTSWESQLSMFKAAIAHSKNSTIDIVITCAGITGASLVKTATPLDLPEGADLPKPSTHILDVNLTGTFYSTNLALHYFHKYPEPSSVKKQLHLVASIAGYGPLPLNAEYGMSKFGVRGLFKSLRGLTDPFHPTGIRVNLVAPAFVHTPMTSTVVPFLRNNGIGVAEIPDFVVGVMHLCCDDSIDGRAIAIAPRGEKAPGAHNFDLCDDEEGHDGGRELWTRMDSHLGIDYGKLGAFATMGR